MRFKRGTKVEVWCQRGIPLGSWRCGEIVGGNGHDYTVKYDGSAVVLERVAKRSIRPCPPPQSASQWRNHGDVVEVFHGFSWTMATVLNVINEGYIAVRPVGTFTQLKVSNRMIRSRQSWDGTTWTTIGQIEGKRPKRKRVEHSHLHNLNGTKPQQRSGFPSAANLEVSTSESVTCSVGSCSISGDNWRKICHLRLDSGNVEGLCSDAESYFKRSDGRERKTEPSTEELAAEIHKLELRAYRCTIEALHASGPLSWDQEAMMTNLRRCLNISNDEHLLEIRNVVSARRCIRSR